MSSSPLDRREFSRSIVAGVAASTIGTPAVGQAAMNLRVRRNLSNPEGATALAAYEKAVGLMKGLEDKDPRGWQKQAEFHAKGCPHNNWFFLPWHRAYLYYFEQICCELLEDPHFALPYWDWSSDLAVPARFLAGNSHLFDPARAVNIRTDKIDDRKAGRGVIAGLRHESFSAFAGAGPNTKTLSDPGRAGLLEGEPHNYIHAFVGGTKGGRMATDRAPLDPLFWPHHAFVDLVFARWTISPKTAQKVWPREPHWGSTKLEFVDRKGTAVSKEVRDVLSMIKLGYTYDEFAEVTPPPAELSAVAKGLESEKSPSIAFTKKPQSLQVGKPLRLPLEIPPDFHSLVATHVEKPASLPNISEVRLVVTFTEIPLTNSGLSVRLYLNPVEDPSVLAENSHPSYLGSAVLFVTQRPEHSGHRPGRAGFVFGLTRLLRNPEIRPTIWRPDDANLVLILDQAGKDLPPSRVVLEEAKIEAVEWVS